MERQELVETWENLIKEYNDILRPYIMETPMKRMSKQDYAKYKQLEREMDNIVKQVEILDGVIWSEETWASEYHGVGETYEECRQNLLDILKSKSGVEIIKDQKNRVKLIQVRTHTKIYQYEIKGYYGQACLFPIFNAKRCDNTKLFMETGKIEQDEDLIRALAII